MTRAAGTPLTVVLAAGGTGGHVFPAQALAAELRERGLEPVLFTDRRGGSFGQEVQVRRIRGGGIAGLGAWARVRSTAALGLGLLQAWWGLKQVVPDAVVGFGGYASLPTVFAARFAGIPAIVHEQNAVLGRANRLLAKRVQRIATAFETVARVPPALDERCVRTGMPVRPAFARLRDQPYHAPEPSGPIRVLVLGGSQGARVFGEVIPAATDRLNARLRTRLHITQQCRPENLAEVEAAYRRIGVNAELAAFFDDVPQRLAGAHLLIARSGSSTVAELTTVGRPSILIPYPFATDDHQAANAQAIADVGGCWLVPQPSFTAESLAFLLEDVLADPERLTRAADAARAAGVERAAANLADLVLEVIGIVPSEPRLIGGRLAA